MGDLKKEPSEKCEAPTNEETTGHPWESVSRSVVAFQSPGIKNSHFHPQQERTVMLLWEKQAGELSLFQYCSLKDFIAKLHRFTDIMPGEQFFPLGHVLEGIAGRKSSERPNSIDRPAIIQVYLSHVSPSLPLNLPLDKICLGGDMFSPKEIF